MPASIDFSETQTRKWNALVSKRLTFDRFTDTHAVFIHPTKGRRRISLKRLMLWKS